MLRSKYLYVLMILCWGAQLCIAQLTPSQIDELITSYDYKDEANVDSILEWAAHVEDESRAIGYTRGIVHSNRMKGYYYDFQGDFIKATELYLKYLTGARENGLLRDEMAAILDLVYIYITNEQYSQAKTLLLELVNEKKYREKDIGMVSVAYNNLGIVFKRTDLIDSAVWSYNNALIIKEELKDSSGMADLKINLSSLYVSLGRFTEAVRLSEENIVYLKSKRKSTDIILNLINKAAGLIELRRNEEAKVACLEALSMADELGNPNMNQLALSSVASLYYKLGDYKKAYDVRAESEVIKGEMVNEQSTLRIAELREEYEAEKRESENAVLTANLNVRKKQIQLYTGGIAGLLALLALLIWVWQMNKSKNRKLESKNEKIEMQNRKLIQLNTDKNNLISLVSHDLSSPLSTIKVWAAGLDDKASAKDVIETGQVITSLSEQALKSIHHALSIDKNELQAILIEEVDLRALIESVLQEFEGLIKEKDISVNVEANDIIINSDVHLLRRIVANLTSNAIKYSHKGGRVDIKIEDREAQVLIKVIDQGLGIDQQSISQIFEPYQKADNSPTMGESSHGLGLSIVKRLAEELGGYIRVQSEVGKGSTFTVELPR